MHQDFFRALTYDHHFRQKSAIYCYLLNSIVTIYNFVATCPNQSKNEVDLEQILTKCADLEQNEEELEHQNNN